MKRIGTARRKTRSKLSKHFRTRGKVSITRYLQTFKEGEPVILHAEPSIQKGMYHPNYYGKHGKIAGKQGTCYFVRIKDKNKEKTLLVHPVHLKRIS
jgi:large subunit ribosomal protein L21e